MTTVEPQLVSHARERRASRPSRRETVTSLCTAATFLSAAAVFALVAHPRGDFSWLTAGALVVTFALLARCEFEIGSGSAVPTQLAFVPMLFVVPLPFVPLLVCCGYLLGAAFDAATGRVPIQRSLALVGCSWFSIGPALVLYLAGAGAPDWHDWPVYLIAFGVQCAGDFVHSSIQQWVAYGLSLSELAPSLARVYAFDALVAPAAFLAARDGSFAFLALTPLLGIFTLLVRERRGRFDALFEAARAEALAHTDPLTGLPNRRAFEERLAAEIDRLRDIASAGFSIAIFDVDHFKAYNDTYGHPAGDELLRALAREWNARLRPGDLLARFGGEEFALLMPRCSVGDAASIVQRLLDRVPNGKTASAGVAWSDGTELAEALVQRADEALYRAKRTGRARLELADEPLGTVYDWNLMRSSVNVVDQR